MSRACGRVALPGGESTSHQHIALKVKVGQCPSVGVQHMLRLHGGMVKQGYLQKKKLSKFNSKKLFQLV